MDETKNMSPEEIHSLMANALVNIRDLKPSRELSIATTQLEDSLMWFNKDRTIKGELTPTETHI